MPETRRVSLVAVTGAIAAVAGIAIVAWVFLFAPVEFGERPAKDITVGRGAPAQSSGESALARRDPAGLADPAGGRARAIKQTAEPLTITEAQQRAVWDIIDAQDVESVDKINFELMIGAAIPDQTRLHDLPPGVADTMKGYWGGQYLVAGNKLIIVDLHTRRVAAIVPKATE